MKVFDHCLFDVGLLNVFPFYVYSLNELVGLVFTQSAVALQGVYGRLNGLLGIVGVMSDKHMRVANYEIFHLPIATIISLITFSRLQQFLSPQMAQAS